MSHRAVVGCKPMVAGRPEAQGVALVSGVSLASGVALDLVEKPDHEQNEQPESEDHSLKFGQPVEKMLKFGHTAP